MRPFCVTDIGCGMPLLRNNARVVSAAAPVGGTRTRYGIEGVKGLQLDCTVDGARIWRCRYQVGNGGRRTERTLKLGSFNSGDADFLTLGQAIDRAHETLVAAKREKRDLFAEQRGIGRGASFDSLFSKWLERHAKVHKKSWEADEALYNRHVKERIGSRAANELKRGDIISFLNDIADDVSGIQANRCQSLVSGIINWAVSEDLLEVSPTHGITKRGVEIARERVFSDAELRKFWGALKPTRIDDAIRLLLLLGQRREEVCYADKSELSEDAWSIPGKLTGRTKNKLPHTVPLTFYARKLFGDGFHIYPTTLSHRVRDMVRKHGINDFRLHDLRHCTATGMAQLGIPRELRERVQNQITGRRQSIGARYDQYEYLAEKRDALARWEAHLLSIVS